jgi:hypothetical protein
MKDYNNCTNKPHCPVVEFISCDALFVIYDETINCPYRINLGDSKICEKHWPNLSL